MHNKLACNMWRSFRKQVYFFHSMPLKVLLPDELSLFFYCAVLDYLLRFPEGPTLIMYFLYILLWIIKLVYVSRVKKPAFFHDELDLA